jgi:predicted O-linked N-acetylglucosamine transferase (SPINDLY family)
VLALHDRSRFEVSAFSFGPDDGSVYRRAIETSVDRFVDISGVPDADAARAIADASVDVLVDLMGHTTGNRLGVLARRPAPVQAHYLGYPGTTGAPYVDYFVSDAAATPQTLRPHFAEQIAYVPDCFLVSDGTDATDARRSSRAEQKLPADVFIFANFGSASRITREDFALWMRILENVSRSVLWLRNTNALVIENLRRDAQRARIDPQRLIFAERTSDKRAHLGRAALADLALDTVGWYNGHSTAADMLWAGVPVVTCAGSTFPSRVASSLVRGAGVPDLVARDAEDYTSISTRLAREPDALHALRTTVQSRAGVFFDTPRLVRGLEEAYAAMYAARISTPAGL